MLLLQVGRQKPGAQSDTTEQDGIAELNRFAKAAGIPGGELPIAGVDGSLRNRIKGTGAEKNVHAKTGTIGHVHTLSGYLTTAGGEHLVFSLMLNGCHDPGHTAKDDIDPIAILLAEFKGRSDTR